MGEKKAVKKLTTEDILNSLDTQEREVFVKEWNGTVTIKPFTKDVQQKTRKLAMREDKIDIDLLEMMIFIEGIVSPKFSEDQYEQLKTKSASAIDTVLKAITEASGITSESDLAEAAKLFRS